jgi:hypothetical protein
MMSALTATEQLELGRLAKKLGRAIANQSSTSIA